MEKRSLYDLSVEISAASMLINGLSNQLDNKETDSLTCESLKLALHGISNYLDRIAENIDDIDGKLVRQKVEY